MAGILANWLRSSERAREADPTPTTGIASLPHWVRSHVDLSSEPRSASRASEADAIRGMVEGNAANRTGCAGSDPGRAKPARRLFWRISVATQIVLQCGLTIWSSAASEASPLQRRVRRPRASVVRPRNPENKSSFKGVDRRVVMCPDAHEQLP